MQAAPQARSVTRPVHMLEQIVYGNHVRTTQPARNPEQVWNVNNIAIQPAHNRPESETAFERVIGFVQGHGEEVRRERSTFRHPLRRTDEEILAVVVQAGEGADYIPDVRANSEFRHATDVDADLHSLDLITGGTEGDREFAISACRTERSQGPMHLFAARNAEVKAIQQYNSLTI